MRLKLSILLIAGLYANGCDDPADDVPKAEVEDHDHDEHDEHDEHEEGHDHGHDEHMSRIMLSATQDSPVQLVCGDVPMYTGRMGRKGSRIAVKIGDRIVKSTS